MTTATSSGASRDSARRGWIHFGIAALILVVTAATFEYAINTLKWVTSKEAVPWPAGVTINPDDFRWENMPVQVGKRYELAEDGELTGGKKDGVPDGEVVVIEEMMETLKIGTALDKSRVGDRRSNWYISRIYRDNTVPPGQPLRYWQLDVYYYTGGMDMVPHVPERCMQAAGASPLGTEELMFRVPAARSPWDRPVPFERARFSVPSENGGPANTVSEYYTFSLNGEPESSWEKVRLTLSSPWVRYCYFAKIQFGPLGPGTNTEATDRAAEDLMNYFLPVIAQALATPSDIETLKATEKAPK